MDTAKQPTTHRTAPTTKNYPAQNVSNTKFDKSCSKRLTRTKEKELPHSLFNPQLLCCEGKLILTETWPAVYVGLT